MASKIHIGKNHRLAELAARQHGVVSRGQMRALGITDSSIGRLLTAGYLHRVFRNAFAVGHQAIGDRGRMLAATLACGPESVVSHRTAAFLFGLQDRPSALVDVIAPRQSGRGMGGIRRHQVPAPHGEEAGHLDAIPCTSPSRTIVDLAGILGERSLRRIVERAAILRVLDVQAIERPLVARRRRGAPTLRAILRPWRTTDPDESTTGRTPAAGRAANPPRLRSELEARLLTAIDASGLPTPTCNRRIQVDPDGRGFGFEVDFLWSEQRLIVETDGKAVHDHPLAFERDRKRDRELQLGGYRVVRFTHRQIEDEPGTVISAIRRLLAQPGHAAPRGRSRRDSGSVGT